MRTCLGSSSSQDATTSTPEACATRTCRRAAMVPARSARAVVGEPPTTTGGPSVPPGGGTRSAAMVPARAARKGFRRAAENDGQDARQGPMPPTAGERTVDEEK